MSGLKPCIQRICQLLTLTVSLGAVFVQASAACSARQKPAVSDLEQIDSSVTQSPPAPNSPFAGLSREQVLERHFAVNFINDQKAIWTSPLHLKKKDFFWLLPSAAILGESLHRDAYLYRALTPAVHTGARSKTFSDASVVALGAGTASMYLLGRLHDNDHQRETAVLATEALANSMTLGYALKYALNRERPFKGNGNGDFFVPGGGGSFPSGHALAAWSMASVIAHEYPGPLTQIGVYGLATAISLARVTGRQHFPSDVLVGSALGWGIGAMTYRRHHDEELPGENTHTIVNDSQELSRSDRASPYVDLDSWVYLSLDRLASLGFIHSSSFNMRPWTRQECARLVGEARDVAGDESDAQVAREAQSLIRQLQNEFSSELDTGPIPAGGLHLDSAYIRMSGITGPPLNDGYHFAESITNDFGRPYSEGANAIAGISGWLTSGHWGAYVHGEYQYAPGRDPIPTIAQIAVANADATPVAAFRASSFDRFRLLDTYVSFQKSDWQISFGKQSQWWGPGEFGALNFSDNAEPVLMLKIERTSPFSLPSIFSWMGPTRVTASFGQLGGQQFVTTINGQFGPNLSRQPLLNAGKISFHPTANLEFGFSVSTIWGGPGLPLNLRAFARSFSLGNSQSGGLPDDPGDRRTGFDFRYSVPGLRKWLVLYSDALSEDEFSPIAYPRKSAFRSGIYLPRLPRASHLDFRAEGVYTDLPNLHGIGVIYYNSRFQSGFTNFGQILGDWIGREGSGFSAQSSFWFSSGSKLSLLYRNANVNPDFVQGGNYDDFKASAEWRLRPTVEFSTSAQYERWRFPLLSSNRNSDLSTTVMLRYRPKTH